MDTTENTLEQQHEKWLESFDFSFYSDWVLDDLKEQASLIGIDIDRIYYSGFSSQGDGAMFTGSYGYKKRWKALVIKEFPANKELLEIGQQLQDIQKKSLYKLTAVSTHRGRHYNDNSAIIDVHYDDGIYSTDLEEDEIASALRSFMQYIYSSLEKEYEYQTSLETFKQQQEDIS